MLASWIINEMKEADLPDKRLNDRLSEILNQFAGKPTASIPAACGGYAEMMGAYRFVNNEKVDFENVLQPHIEATTRRMAEHPVVILAQDTTEIDLTRPEQQVVGAGPLDGNTRRGFFLHPLMGFTPDGTPLGTIYAEAWTRDDDPKTPKSQRRHKLKHTPIEEKESIRWLETYRQALEQAKAIPDTQFICVADSEADIYELLEESQEEPKQLDWIIRACHDRAIQVDDVNTSHYLRQTVQKESVMFTKTISVRGRKLKVRCDTRGRRQPRQSRTAQVEVRAASVTLRAPRRPDRKLSDISINVVLATEIDPPDGDTPVEWILLTSLPIEDIEQVDSVIQYYCVRWLIEVFFRTLKSGCRIESRRFEHIDCMFPCVAIYLIVTWRTLFVCRLGREFPEIDCEAIFEPAEWKSVYTIIHKKPPPSTAPTLQEMVRMVAQLGGYVNRKRSDEPGPQTVWLGLQRTYDIANCWQTFGPGSDKNKILV
jgi:hypothetical protein